MQHEPLLLRQTYIALLISWKKLNGAAGGSGSNGSLYANAKD